MAHLTRVECAYQLRDSGAKVVIAGTDQLANALEAAKQVGLSSDSVFAFGEGGISAKSTGTRNWIQIWVSEEEARSWHWRKISARKELEDTTAIINYSSGQVVSFFCAERFADQVPELRAYPRESRSHTTTSYLTPFNCYSNELSLERPPALELVKSV
jgi:hypothetical protein